MTCTQMIDCVKALPVLEGTENFIAALIDGSIDINTIPDYLSGITSIESNAFDSCEKLAITSIPESVTIIGSYAFAYCTGLTTLTFKGTPASIGYDVFRSCTNLTTINVPWSEGEVAGAPWGARNATINYNYVGE